MRAEELNNALIDAAKSGDIGAIRAILAGRGADGSLNTALRLALREGQLLAASYLIDRGARLNHYPACLCADKNAQEAVELLVEKGALDVNAHRAFELREAARAGRADIVGLLLDQGANARAQNNAALREAARQGHQEVVRLLLEKGADPRANHSDALAWAARNGHAEVVRLLLERGADARAQDFAALRHAVRRESPAAVRELFERGGLSLAELEDESLREKAGALLSASLEQEPDPNADPRRRLFPWVLTIRRS